MVYPYNYKMGITVNGVAIPDPSEWNYQVGDLDTSGSRDATGMLHRARVATKINYEFKWNAVEWEMLALIVNAVKDEKFTLVAPDPREFVQPTAQANYMDYKKYTGSYYVGDRTGKGWYFLPGNKKDVATFDLKLKFIEY